MGIMALLDRVAPPGEALDPALVGIYGWMAAMQTLGFAAFFGDPLVAFVGGLAMVPPAVAAARGVRRG
jgi:putative membrane protein